MEGEREGETRGEKKGRRFPVPGTDGRGRSARTGAADRQRGGGGARPDGQLGVALSRAAAAGR
jgi:hypothetical protein